MCGDTGGTAGTDLELSCVSDRKKSVLLSAGSATGEELRKGNCFHFKERPEWITSTKYFKILLMRLGTELLFLNIFTHKHLSPRKISSVRTFQSVKWELGVQQSLQGTANPGLYPTVFPTNSFLPKLHVKACKTVKLSEPKSKGTTSKIHAHCLTTNSLYLSSIFSSTA